MQCKVSYIYNISPLYRYHVKQAEVMVQVTFFLHTSACFLSFSATSVRVCVCVCLCVFVCECVYVCVLNLTRFLRAFKMLLCFSFCWLLFQLQGFCCYAVARFCYHLFLCLFHSSFILPASTTNQRHLIYQLCFILSHLASHCGGVTNENRFVWQHQHQHQQQLTSELLKLKYDLVELRATPTASLRTQGCCQVHFSSILFC